MSNIMINVPGRVVHDPDLVEPGGAPGFPVKYSVTFQVDKNAPEMREILEQMQIVAHNTWDSDLAAKNLAAVQQAITDGTDPKLSPCSIQDGDVRQPEYNAGTFVLKASRRIDQGAPPLFGIDGLPIVDAAKGPKNGDGVIVAVNVWAMKKHMRINFTCEGVRLAVIGVRTGGPPPAAIAAGLASLSQMALPPLIPGVQAQAALPAQAPQAVAAAQPVLAQPQQEIVAPEPVSGASDGLALSLIHI